MAIPKATSAPVPVKQCTKCKQSKDMSAFNADRTRTDGLSPWCRECRKRSYKEHYEQVESAKRKARRQTGPEYYKRLQREWRRKNAAKVKLLDRQRYRRDKAKRLAMLAKRYTKKKAEIRAKQNAYWWANRAKILAAKKRRDGARIEEIRARQRAYWRTHREVYYAAKARRKARLRGLPADWKRADQDFALRYWSGACPVCGAVLGKRRKVNFDHWIPLAAPECPGTVPRNMLPLCAGCNLAKRHKAPALWLEEKFGSERTAQILGEVAKFFRAVRQIEGTGHRRSRAHGPDARS